uniref:hypothetical protein n=1 Tax=Burkholderia cepacia TaxID=292 RepID=UPI0015E86446|nr:hypothetical protein [Burkholderia cepacia]
MEELAGTIEALGAAREAARAEMTDGLAEAAADLHRTWRASWGTSAVHDLVSDPDESTGADARA